MSTGTWVLEAACSGVNPELFFPVSEDGPATDLDTREAKTICAGCPVRAACLEFALRSLPYGIAGGLTPEERRGLVAAGRSPAEVSTSVAVVRPSASREQGRGVA